MAPVPGTSPGAGTPIQGVDPGLSWVSVCNTALRAVGKDRISSIGDGGDENSRLCADLLTDAITAVMSADDDWCVLRARAILNQDGDYTPAFGFSYAYLLPSDCSDFQKDGVLAIDPLPSGQLPREGTQGTYRWRREGKWILTDAGAVYLTYQRNPMNEDATTLPDWFKHAVHDQLAVSLCMPGRQSPALMRFLTKQAADSLRNAIANDDKMKYVASGVDTRGYGYYEETRGGGPDERGDDPSDPNRMW